MTKVECINCGEFHQVDSIEGQVGDEHAKVKYTCPENGTPYGSSRFVDELENVNQQGDELAV
jgi:hypothetical protein